MSRSDDILEDLLVVDTGGEDNMEGNDSWPPKGLPPPGAIFK
jgi:hypothetical protein